jgi:hypothetical protein
MTDSCAPVVASTTAAVWACLGVSHADDELELVRPPVVHHQLFNRVA